MFLRRGKHILKKQKVTNNQYTSCWVSRLNKLKQKLAIAVESESCVTPGSFRSALTRMGSGAGSGDQVGVVTADTTKMGSPGSIFSAKIMETSCTVLW